MCDGLKAHAQDDKLGASNQLKLQVPISSPSQQCAHLEKGLSKEQWNSLGIGLATDLATKRSSELHGVESNGVEFHGVELHSLQRTFFDDFNKLDLSDSGWSPHFDGGYDEKTKTWLGYDNPNKRTLKGNKEQQLYVDPAYQGDSPQSLNLNPFLLKDGKLSIVAQRTPASLQQALYGYQYYSGLLTTRKSFAQRYGYFEMRAKLPAGKAIWPAFWLLPLDRSWPPELDIVELVGQQPDLIVTTVHSGESIENYQSSGCRTKLSSATSRFHLYGAYWQANKVTFYIDRQAVAQIATPPTMNKPMYMLLNLAVGGKMVGVADSETPVPAKFEIDWVAAYQSKALGAIK